MQQVQPSAASALQGMAANSKPPVATAAVSLQPALQQPSGKLDTPVTMSADQSSQEAQATPASMPVQQAPVGESLALPEDLLDRLDGFASQDELKELRGQLNEVLEQLQHLSSQQRTDGLPNASRAFPPGAGKMWIDVSTDNAMQSPRFASIESPIFASVPAEHSPTEPASRKQRGGEAYQQQQQEQQQSSRQAPKQSQTLPADANPDIPESSMASADEVIPVRSKLQTMDLTSSAAPGWDMQAESLDVLDAPEQAMPENKQEGGLTTGAIDRANDTISQQQQYQARQNPKIQIQTPAGNRIRTAAFQKQSVAQQKADQGDLSLRLEPVSPGPQTLLVSTPEKSTPAGKHVPATVQMVLASDSTPIRQIAAGIPVLAPASALPEQAAATSTADNHNAEDAARSSSSMMTDNLEAGQRLIVERALVPQQALWIQRPKTGASAGAASGDGQDSITVEQLAASLQTVAAVTHAMALGPPSQATSASSQVTWVGSCLSSSAEPPELASCHYKLIGWIMMSDMAASESLKASGWL